MLQSMESRWTGVGILPTPHELFCHDTAPATCDTCTVCECVCVGASLLLMLNVFMSFKVKDT